MKKAFYFIDMAPLIFNNIYRLQLLLKKFGIIYISNFAYVLCEFKGSILVKHRGTALLLTIQYFVQMSLLHKVYTRSITAVYTFI